MPTFRITLSYDGTGFVGWQRQAAGVSIQGLLEDALSELDGRDVAVLGAGRTDAGVHALGQAASFTLARTIDSRTVVAAVNARLPEAVRVLTATEVDESFHARFHARAKTYRYRIWNADVLSPFERQYVWHVASPALDVDAMAKAATFIEGAHDFAAFQAAGAETRSTERRVSRSCVSVSDGGSNHLRQGYGGQAGPALRTLVVYEVTGNGFLRHMVRTIVGSLVEVGRGRRSPDWIGEVLASRDRTHAGPTAPAEGLFLVHVTYDD